MKCGRILAVAATALLLLLKPAIATAPVLTYNIDLWPSFTFSLSTSDSTTGTTVLSSGWSYTSFTGSVALTPGTMNFIHLSTGGGSGYSPGVIGDFTLSGGGTFANGATTIVTDNATGWNFSQTGFGTGYYSPTVRLGSTSLYDVPTGAPTSYWLIDSNLNYPGDLWMSVAINLPEPASGLLLLAPLTAITMLRRRR